MATGYVFGKDTGQIKPTRVHLLEISKKTILSGMSVRSNSGPYMGVRSLVRFGSQRGQMTGWTNRPVTAYSGGSIASPHGIQHLCRLCPLRVVGFILIGK